MSGTGDLSEAATSVVYTIRHVIRDETLDDVLAARHARALLVEPIVGLTPEQEYAGLAEALSSSARLATWFDDPAFERAIEENEFRGHLLRVRDHLDRARPWPHPPLRALDPQVWRDYSEPRLVGRLHLRMPRVEDRLHTHLFPVSRDGEQVHVAILALRSGREVAVVGHWWPEDLRATAILTRDHDASAEELMDELTSGDLFEPGEYEVVQA